MSSLSASTSAGPPPRPDRRGLCSCLLSPTCRAQDSLSDPDSGDEEEEEPLPTDKELPGAIYERIVGFYDQAFNRLPCETMPDLLDLLRTSGLCLGLLDPVSNIILNTIALLPDDDLVAPASAPAAKRSKRLARAALSGSDRAGCPWRKVAVTSYYSLLDFLITYFGCITMEQAIRYLYWARADLATAVILVEHDLYQDGGTMGIQPASARTQAALRLAADRVGHPDPDAVAQVMAARLQGHAFDLLKTRVAEGAVLSSDDVRQVRRVLHAMISSPCDAQVSQVDEDVVIRVSWDLDGVAETTDTVNVSSTDGGTTTRTITTTIRRLGRPITSVHLERLRAEMLPLPCVIPPYFAEEIVRIQCGESCDYFESLKMCAHGMIHSFYLEALKLLPTPSGSLMRILFMASHCYGSMDPVSNIIVNAIWYKKHEHYLTKPLHEKIEPYTDILDPLSLLRPVVCSLKGLIELDKFIDPLLATGASALEMLCSSKCDIAIFLSRERLQRNPFQEAAKAAGHPLPLQLGELHQQLLLMPVERSKVLSLMAEARTCCTVLPIDEISSVLEFVLSRSMAPEHVQFQAPDLCAEALSVVIEKESQYEARRRMLRAKVEKLLEKYASHHFWEPKYTLNFICGVEEIGRGPSCYYNKCYHVNFMATFEPQLQKILFFAEFWQSHEPKPSFCCPLPSPYVGRCFYGVDSARKLAYPDREEYILKDITEHGTRNVHDLIESDLVYFSPERDVDVAVKLNGYYARDFPVSRRPVLLWC